MPPVARPGDRLAMESALTAEDLEVLHSMCAILGVPADRWPSCPMLARPWSTLAVLRLAARLRAEDGLAHQAALERAALRLGLSPATVRNRVARA